MTGSAFEISWILSFFSSMADNLDIVIVSSENRFGYLRSRIGSSVSGSTTGKTEDDPRVSVLFLEANLPFPSSSFAEDAVSVSGLRLPWLPWSPDVTSSILSWRRATTEILEAEVGGGAAMKLEFELVHDVMELMIGRKFKFKRERKRLHTAG